MTFALTSDCLAYSRNESDCASFKAIAIAAIVCIWGHHCTHGNTDLSINVGRFSIVRSGALRGFDTIPLDKIIAPLGHLNDLCVVVIIA